LESKCALSTRPPRRARRPALAVHARTLELYRQLDLTDFVIGHGHKVPAVHLWVKGESKARISFEEVASDLTPYSFLQIFPQDEHERLLIAGLNELGISVERQTELLSYSDRGTHVIARLRRADGQEESCDAAYIAGCDCAHSIVRDTMGTGYPGGTYRQLFYVADVEASGPTLEGELHVDLDEADFVAVFPLAGKGRARLIGTVRDERAAHPDALKFDYLSSRIIENLKVKVEKVNWFSTYHVHHRVTEHFRKGRAFLLGDAATADGKLADIIRMRIVPILAKFEAWREFMFRTVSQVTINYRHSYLSEGQAGKVHGGDCLPWVVADGTNNYDPLVTMAWQVHAYGTASPELMTWCKEHDLPLHVFPWRPEHGEAGLLQHALYLVRPDTYVALADRSGTTDVLQHYFDARGIRNEPSGKLRFAS